MKKRVNISRDVESRTAISRTRMNKTKERTVKSAGIHEEETKEKAGASEQPSRTDADEPAKKPGRKTAGDI